MSNATLDRLTTTTRTNVRVAPLAAALQRRAVFLMFAAAGFGAGFLITGQAAAANAASLAGEDLTRLLRGMAAIKAAIILPAIATIVWRLGTPATSALFAAYTASAAAMTLSIGLIWHMAHVGPGALLMHAGLIGTLVLLFRDKAVGERLASALKARARR
jgi:hypothetical protein